VIQRVVYLLGAGFSAPLGLPVMANFLAKAKDLYFEDQERYPHFREVFERIREFSVAKNYFEADLFNLEEVFSILEMARQLEGRRAKSAFSKFLSDVVVHYTPALTGHARGDLPGNWYKFVLGGERANDYGFFIAGLHNLRLQEVGQVHPTQWHGAKPERAFDVGRCESPATRYGVITLNYDKVLEGYDALLRAELGVAQDVLAFSTGPATWEEPFAARPLLVKLHGSVDSDRLVPPTWSKAIDRQILPAWRMAYNMLVMANHLRVIGYSLPDSDAYMRYLLKAAVMSAPNLKNIDVLCLDPDGAVQRRFDKFVRLPTYRFKSASVTDYLKVHAKYRTYHEPLPNHTLDVDKLEQAHEEFFRS
jgi:hypothetical protein